MSVLNNATNLLLGAAGSTSAYQVSRSLRFNSADSAYLNRTPASAGNRKTWTWAGWVKRSGLGDKFLFSAYIGSGSTDNDYFGLRFVSSDQLRVGGYSTIYRLSTAVFRDVSAWYHIVCAVDTTQGTATNRIKLWVNGSQITTFSTENNPTQNADLGINQAAGHTIGREAGFASYQDGYLAEVHFIDGQALDPSSFTETDATTGQLIPKAYSGSYGSNGWKLSFSDNSTTAALGTDTSGNGNTWTVNNLSVNSGGPTSVAAATGALPVYNTTDTYGTVKGTGTRTDSNSSSIVLALPMDGTNGGTSFGDQSAVIKGSGSAKTVTVVGDTSTRTAVSKFYGSSGYFDGSGDYLTCASSADLTVGTGAFTAECWVYTLAQSGILFQNYDASNAGWGFRIQDFANNVNGVGFSTIYGGVIIGFVPGILPTATWTHVAAVWSASGSNCSVYINGVFARTISNVPATAQNTFWIGAQGDQGPGVFFTGYMQDLRIYKGVAKYTSNFNVPTATLITTVAAANDSLVDTPTSYGTDTGVGGEVRSNYCTLNPLDKATTGGALSNGNLDYAATVASWDMVRATFGISSGKWYWEVSVNSTTYGVTGIAQSSVSLNNNFFNSGMCYGYNANNGYKYEGSPFASLAYGATWNGSGDICGVAFNSDAGTLTFYKNGVSQGVAYTGLTGTYFPTHTSYPTGSATFNFGQRAFAYTAPSGFKALCTQNLPAPVVAKPNTVMDVVLYTGTGAALTPTSSLGFNPDWIWIKSRSAATDHALYDVVRGAQARLESNTTDTEVTTDGGVTAFNSAGFTLGTLAQVNTSSATYAAWCWDAGTSTVTNTAGSISSQVRANASAGFSVVTYTGTGANATVGHGLGIAPSMVIVKQRNGTFTWRVYHASLANTQVLYLSATDAATTETTAWNSTTPTSSVVSLGTGGGVNGSSDTYVAYCFAPVSGYSSFGSFTGGGTTPVFVYLGFRPKFLLVKNASSGGTYDYWLMKDSARDTYNASINTLVADRADAENTPATIGTNQYYDFVSNGFVNRTVGSFNSSGNTFVYAAFAESPFQYARAR
jgi:hypothetical protein